MDCRGRLLRMSEFKEKRKMFDSLSNSVNLGIGYLFKTITRVTCPCCGYPTLAERARYETCVLCNWEDDGQDDVDAVRVLGGPNGEYSLDEARENFAKYRTMYTPGNNIVVTGDDSVEAETLKKQLIVIFEEMLQADSADIPKIWKRVFRLEQDLEATICK